MSNSPFRTIKSIYYPLSIPPEEMLVDHPYEHTEVSLSHSRGKYSIGAQKVRLVKSDRGYICKQTTLFGNDDLGRKVLREGKFNQKKAIEYAANMEQLAMELWGLTYD